MHWHKYRKFRGKDTLPFIAMMAASKGAWGSGFGSSFDWDSDDRGGRGRRRRRSRMFGQGELRLALLALIHEQPRHGYELIKAIEELTGGEYAPSPGAVYPTLQLLQDEGMIAEAEAEGPRKPFQATVDGIAELEGRADEVEALLERLAEHGERQENVRSHDLFRAMGNLAMVLKHRARAGKLDKGTVEEIVDLVDELARKIERL
ncbi:PadR family transcriptional regulator [Altererythrobacter arenosus]|uniref:PadR family transcriptional regulator n=1 Tax=Altererythrobacter arenosus TaxID=3032592 RepID=A0ABY8FSZ4_9SPHN|nr:PadR family transcriptional regulator [Altererythrobacter sp. CAU 1644]WFL77957.1 PadR family transcriptional regulator [Altererythrobacter sp. CAU 1644]